MNVRKNVGPSVISVALAQMGPNSRKSTRTSYVQRMCKLFDEAVLKGARMVVFPELALSPYFPVDVGQETREYVDAEMPNDLLFPLVARAVATGVGFYFGYAEKSPGGELYNTALFIDGSGKVAGKYRKIHLPGLRERAEEGKTRVYEPHYFNHGRDGFTVVEAAGVKIGLALCQDRRFPETYRLLTLAGAQVILIGYNTMVSMRGLDQHEICLRAGAYENGAFVLSVAKCGNEDGTEFMAGTCAVDPHGMVVARSSSFGDEVVVVNLNLEEIDESRARWNFFERRWPDLYGALTLERSAE